MGSPSTLEQLFFKKAMEPLGIETRYLTVYRTEPDIRSPDNWDDIKLSFLTGDNKCIPTERADLLRELLRVTPVT